MGAVVREFRPPIHGDREHLGDLPSPLERRDPLPGKPVRAERARAGKPKTELFGGQPELRERNRTDAAARTKHAHRIYTEGRRRVLIVLQTVTREALAARMRRRGVGCEARTIGLLADGTTQCPSLELAFALEDELGIPARDWTKPAKVDRKDPSAGKA
jgi:hypothetical protein